MTATETDLRTQLRSIHAQRREHMDAIARLDEMEARIIGSPDRLRKTNTLSKQDTKALFSQLRRNAL